MYKQDEEVWGRMCERMSHLKGPRPIGLTFDVNAIWDKGRRTRS